MKIELTTSPAKQDLQTISLGIQSYNQSYLADKVVYEADTTFAVFAKDKTDKIIGGIRATAFWNYCIIELLWLAKESRGHGVGSQLMQKAEAFASEKGFEYVRTETIDFQAKPFYQKMGYTVYGELPDCPKGNTTYCLVKSLTKKQ